MGAVLRRGLTAGPLLPCECAQGELVEHPDMDVTRCGGLVAVQAASLVVTWLMSRSRSHGASSAGSTM
jgi:hypothetical protein